jgi:hypothetical protein
MSKYNPEICSFYKRVESEAMIKTTGKMLNRQSFVHCEKVMMGHRRNRLNFSRRHNIELAIEPLLLLLSMVVDRLLYSTPN